jgi:amino acid transporter
MTDYVLNVAVGISAGVGALISAIPSLQPSRLTLCILILILLIFVNLRGIREAGTLFILPTCVFMVSPSAIILCGIAATISSGGQPLPVDPPAPLAETTEAMGAWML